MSIELTVLLSVVSVSFAIFFGLKSARRATKADDQKEATDMTTVAVRLETIRDGVNEIKSEMKSLRDELKSVRDEVRDVREQEVKTQESLKSAWNRINELARRGGRSEV